MTAPAQRGTGHDHGQPGKPAAQERTTGFVLKTHRYPSLRSEGSHSLQLFVRYVDRHRQSGWVGVTNLVVIIYFCYPPAFIGYTL